MPLDEGQMEIFVLRDHFKQNKKCNESTHTVCNANAVASEFSIFCT